MTDLFNLRKYEAGGHAVNLYSTMLFFSTILSPEHVYIHNISQFKSFVNSRRIFLEKSVSMKMINLENKCFYFKS